MTAFACREATAADIPALLLLLRELLTLHAVPTPPGERLERVLRQALASPSHTFIVAEQRGTLVGMCALVFSLSTWTADNICELQDVVVSAPYRARGAGRDLLTTAFAHARQQGCARVFLASEAWNYDAHAFYRRLGFDEKACRYFERPL